MFLSTYYIEMDFTYVLKSIYNSFPIYILYYFILNCYAWKTKYK